MAESEPAVYDAAAASPFAATPVERVRPNARLIVLLSLGHLVVDLNQGSLPAVLPFLKAAHQLSYAAAATIVLAANVTSSLIQPLFGYFADQTARRWMLPISVLLSGAGLALTGLGPPVITGLVTALGVAGSLGMLVPAAVVSLLLVAVLPAFAQAPAPRVARAAAAHGVNMPGAMALLILVVSIRSWTSLGFTTFVPFYYIDVLKADPRLVGPLLFVFLGAGALGTVAAGPLADRWGPRAFMQWGFLAAIPFGLLFLQTGGLLAFVMLGLFGAVLTSSFTVSVVLGQAYLPRNAGMASGLIVGFAIGTGGLGVAALGWAADHYGLPTALWASALLPLAGFVATRFLPAPRDAK